MDIQTVKPVYFSPTGTTKKVVEGVAEGTGINTGEPVDLTPPVVETRQIERIENVLAIIGVPVYGGRVSLDAVNRLRRLKASNTPAVIIVVYGNHDYGDALLELYDLAVGTGFKPVAGGTFIGEHALLPIADGRPDAEDLKNAKKFGRKIRDNIKKIKTSNDISPLQIPGVFPYREIPTAQEVIQTYPTTKDTLCTKCETCLTVCPTAAITINDTVITDTDVCILCCACVKNCPTQARVMDSPHYRNIIEFANKNLPERKEPEIFVGF